VLNGAIFDSLKHSGWTNSSAWRLTGSLFLVLSLCPSPSGLFLNFTICSSLSHTISVALSLLLVGWSPIVIFVLGVGVFLLSDDCPYGSFKELKNKETAADKAATEAEVLRTGGEPGTVAAKSLIAAASSWQVCIYVCVYVFDRQSHTHQRTHTCTHNLHTDSLSLSHTRTDSSLHRQLFLTCCLLHVCEDRPGLCSFATCSPSAWSSSSTATLLPTSSRHSTCRRRAPRPSAPFSVSSTSACDHLAAFGPTSTARASVSVGVCTRSSSRPSSWGWRWSSSQPSITTTAPLAVC